MTDLFKTYSLKQAKADSTRALAEYKDRWWKKFEAKTAGMRKERLAKTGVPVNCIISGVGVLLLVAHSFA